MRTIGEFELTDHGIHHSQYFQGCGLSSGCCGESFENVATGIGDNPAEAIDDCLEQMAQAGFETEDMEARIMKQEGWDKLPKTPNAYKLHDNSGELHYHVSIRWNEAKPS